MEPHGRTQQRLLKFAHRNLLARTSPLLASALWRLRGIELCRAPPYNVHTHPCPSKPVRPVVRPSLPACWIPAMPRDGQFVQNSPFPRLRPRAFDSTIPERDAIDPHRLLWVLKRKIDFPAPGAQIKTMQNATPDSASTCVSARECARCAEPNDAFAILAAPRSSGAPARLRATRRHAPPALSIDDRTSKLRAPTAGAFDAFRGLRGRCRTGPEFGRLNGFNAAQKPGRSRPKQSYLGRPRAPRRAAGRPGLKGRPRVER